MFVVGNRFATFTLISATSVPFGIVISSFDIVLLFLFVKRFAVGAGLEPAIDMLQHAWITISCPTVFVFVPLYPELKPVRGFRKLVRWGVTH